ncbi:MAG: hypothetical protein KIG60_00510 [Caryophanon sp.]|nr:hypothetical protein [Caryophanon sp.]
MKISSLLIQDRQSQAQTLEERRKAIGRKDAGQAYRKNAEYFGEKRNDALKALEDLLSGKLDKETNMDVTDKPRTKEEQLQQPEVQQEIKQLMQTDREIRTHEQAHKAVGGSLAGPVSYEYTTGPDDKQYAVAGEVPINTPRVEDEDEMLTILEKVRQAALAPAQPSAQDLRVAANASAQIQQLRGEIVTEETTEQTEEIPDYVTASSHIDIPERFTREQQLDGSKETAFSQDYSHIHAQRQKMLALNNYESHMTMVKNGYRDPLQPKLSLTA